MRLASLMETIFHLDQIPWFRCFVFLFLLEWLAYVEDIKLVP